MKLKHAAVLLTASFLAACGGGTPEGDVRFLGFAPVTAKDKDVRSVGTFCPNCHEPFTIDQTTDKGSKNVCENKKCKTKVVWADNYRCPSCQGTGRCAACTAMEQAGDCYNCRGQGVLIYAGQSPNCPNCKGSKQCPICKGTQKCDYCKGEKFVKDLGYCLTKEDVKARAAKKDDLPPSDSETKKEEPPKKEEPKKEGGSEEKK